MSDEAPTTPMLETILKEMRAGFGSMNERFTSIETRLSGLETRISSIEMRLSAVERWLETVENQLFNIDIRLDQIDGIASKAHSEVMFLRVDFKEFRARFKETA
jgi:DNA repair ATPase RecN